jgi:hypothetical protein
MRHEKSLGERRRTNAGLHEVVGVKKFLIIADDSAIFLVPFTLDHGALILGFPVCIMAVRSIKSRSARNGPLAAPVHRICQGPHWFMGEV